MAQRLTPDMIKRAGYGMDHLDYKGTADEKSWFEHLYLPSLSTSEIPDGYEIVPAMSVIASDRPWGFFNGSFGVADGGTGGGGVVWPYNYVVCQAKSPPAPLVPKWSCRHKRLPEDSRCPVCAAWSGRIVTT
jgi:hypothetical protein